jgi:hypothetical protein
MNQHKANVVVYFGSTVTENDREQIEGYIRRQIGVFGTRINHRTRQLMLVDYDPGVVSATSLLQGIYSQGVNARLIGM